MNPNEQRLLELNELLSKLNRGRESFSHNQLEAIRQAVSAGMPKGITATVLTQGTTDDPTPPDPSGPTGPTGPTGATGASGPKIGRAHV